MAQSLSVTNKTAKRKTQRFRAGQTLLRGCLPPWANKCGGTMEKLTKWYPGHIKPVREGVYERNYQDKEGKPPCVLYCFWNGSWWGSFAMNSRTALEHPDAKSPAQDLPWRDLASDPEKSGK